MHFGTVKSDLTQNLYTSGTIGITGTIKLMAPEVIARYDKYREYQDEYSRLNRNKSDLNELIKFVNLSKKVSFDVFGWIKDMLNWDPE